MTGKWQVKSPVIWMVLIGILDSIIRRCMAVISVPEANYWGLPGPAPRPIHFVDLPLHCAFRNGKEQILRLTDQYFSANIWCFFNCVWYPFSGSPSPCSVYNAIHRLPPSYKWRNGLCGGEELMSLPGQLLPDGIRTPIASRSMNMGDFYPNTPGIR
jgi:hypothetical protein